MDNNEMLEMDEQVEVIDLDGKPFAIIGELEHENELYFALIPYDKEENENEEEELEFVILKEMEENGEHFLATIDDDDFYEKIGGMFLELFADGGEIESDE
jgi:hypothetical protein